jgi:hypothetical protein
MEIEINSAIGRNRTVDLLITLAREEKKILNVFD